MRKDLHPKYPEVVFHDTSNDFMFITRSCADTKGDVIDFEGASYPCYKLDISSASHPFYTGKKMFVDTAGRVEKFKKRYEKKN